MQQEALNPFASVLYVMPKPVGSACNLACTYCYYLEKGNTLACDHPENQMMSDATLEEFVKQYIAAQTVPEIVFTWHGGEAMMRPIKFYERAMELQRKYGKGRQIINCIQTNGTLLTPRWCEFLKRNNWLVGISIDGPADAHDAFRRTALGKPTHQTVMRSIRMLQQYGVEWNAMAVVNSVNVLQPELFYDFFKQIGCRYLQFTPVVERRSASGNGALCTPDDVAGQLTPESITPHQWGEFAVRVFDRWVRNDVGNIFVQLFDATLAGWVGVTPGVCSLAPSCGHAAMMEHNGDLYSCDHFAFPEFRLGNIHHHSIIELMNGTQQQQFGQRKQLDLPTECKNCPYKKACHGECPKNRFILSPDGQRHNYLCAGYRRYFSHVAPVMDFMASELAANRPPANIMNHPEILDNLP